MALIINIADKTRRFIRLTKIQFQHIAEQHPEISEFHHEIEATLKHPTKLVTLWDDPSIGYYYKFLKHQKPSGKYLLVIVKYLNGEGFIITVYLTQKLT
ncbi:MAG: hypothetical protein QF632_02035 [Candidatus Woesearchaeota archaeon]|jgi:hypothetical protein|nr:hypothetical protein [Candidatus Woesearchaeota archaeon]MDP7458575.1 hypothetical protein [Candidatus Woesearchaeota archaeon]